MKIKNNSIIVRKCNSEVFNKLVSLGFDWHDKTNKILTIPFDVFNEKDLFNTLINSNIKFYAIPLDAKTENNEYALITNEFKINNSFNCALHIDNHKIDISYITEFLDFCKDISYSNSDDNYSDLILSLREYVKNPIFYNNNDLYEAALRLQNDSYKNSIKESSTFEDKFRYSKYEGKNLYFSDDNFVLNTLNKKLLSRIKEEYDNAEIVFWYYSIPEC